MSRYLFAVLLLALETPSLAETRPWKSADGIRTIQGEFIKRDATSVTIRNGGEKVIVIDLSKLHPDERKWLDAHHSLEAPAPDPSAFFDTLTFTDTRDSALAKLKASKLVEMTGDETFMGRTGMNGFFRTRKKVGGLDCSLYFDWTEAGKLKELTLQTETRPATAYKTELKASWTEFVDLLGVLYGKPMQKGPFPPLETLGNGAFSPSHLWAIEAGGSALLGSARDEKKYQLVVRFTQKKVQPVEIP